MDNLPIAQAPRLSTPGSRKSFGIVFLFATLALIGGLALACTRPISGGSKAASVRVGSRYYPATHGVTARGLMGPLVGRMAKHGQIHTQVGMAGAARGQHARSYRRGFQPAFSSKEELASTTPAATSPSRPKPVISSKLDWINVYTEIVPDVFTMDEGLDTKPKRSATVSGRLVLRLLELKGQQFIDEEVTRSIAPVEGASMSVSIQPKEQIAEERRNVYAIVAAELARGVSGKVSVEVDPRVCHDATLCVEEVQLLARAISNQGIDVKDKILFKIPGTWEGILAAKMITLQEHFSCQVTHVYSMAQASAAADAKVAVIQPYVGRVNDWYRLHPDKVPSGEEGLNPGVNLVKKIYNFIKKYEFNTKVMAASVRNVEDAISISGVDYIILAPALIKKLATMPGDFGPPNLTREAAANAEFTPQDTRGHELGECAEELLKASIKASSDTIDQVELILGNTAIGNM